MSRCPPDFFFKVGGPFQVSCSLLVKSYWVGGGWVGGLQDFSVSPIPLDPNWVFELCWTGLGLRLGVLGTGIDNKTDFCLTFLTMF